MRLYFDAFLLIIEWLAIGIVASFFWRSTSLQSTYIIGIGGICVLYFLIVRSLKHYRKIGSDFGKQILDSNVSHQTDLFTEVDKESPTEVEYEELS